jgi:hypothetical protein
MALVADTYSHCKIFNPITGLQTTIPPAASTQRQQQLTQLKQPYFMSHYFDSSSFLKMMQYQNIKKFLCRQFHMRNIRLFPSVARFSPEHRRRRHPQINAITASRAGSQSDALLVSDAREIELNASVK